MRSNHHLPATWPKLLRFSLGATWGILLLAIMASCGSSKIKQCNQLITIINRTSDDLSLIQTGGQANMQAADQMAAQLEKFGASLAKNIQEMQSIGVDPQLDPLKAKLVAAYQTALKNSQALTQAIKTKNQPAAQTALNQLNAASSTEAALLKQISNYCQAPEPK